MPPTTSLCLRSRIATSRKREIVAGRGQWDTRSGAGFARGRDQQHTWSGVRGGLRPRSEVGGGTAENRFSNPAHRRGKTHLSANNQISALHSPARVRRSVVSAPASPRRSPGQIGRAGALGVRLRHVFGWGYIAPPQGIRNRSSAAPPPGPRLPTTGSPLPDAGRSPPPTPDAGRSPAPDFRLRAQPAPDYGSP